ncbi:sensor histidine kinase [Acetonema longum]|uniref:HAMP domain-containing sensor histidine kinase n=1 Tax=Acetonema longum TaxID=2374 RepID=UPI00145F6339|nr:HAMP domain-containing sensor histidine kinase [Acetonema longum]
MSVLLFLCLQAGAGIWIEKRLRQPQFVKEQLQEEVSRLQAYILEENVSVLDFHKLNKWVASRKITMISMYQNGRLIYDSNASGLGAEPPPGDALYPLHFHDADVMVSITSFLKHRYEDIATYMNLVIFFFVFLLIMLSFVRQKTLYIHRLDHEIKLMQGGNLDFPITVKGNDELGSLARDIDNMRRSLLLQNQRQERLETVNRNFATAISHDVRTPLSALIGYLEIMIQKKNLSDEQRRQYLHTCQEKAWQLKKLTDNMFEYLVTASDDDAAGLNTNIDHSLLEHLIYDGVLLLDFHGFITEFTKPENIHYSISFPIDSLQRIFDNIFSNLIKYADPAKVVSISAFIDHTSLYISFSNTVRAAASQTASTGLGLKTSKSLLAQNGGSLVIAQDEAVYTLTIELPVN